MDLEQPNMTGTLTKNRHAGENEPAYIGEVCVAGVVYRIEAAVAEAPSGKFFEMVIIPPPDMAQTAVTPGHYPEATKAGGRRKPLVEKEKIPF